MSSRKVTFGRVLAVYLLLQKGGIMKKIAKWLIGTLVVSMVQNIDKRQLINSIRNIWNSFRKGGTTANPTKQDTQTAANSRNFQTQGKF
jgi:hypothetical protein